MADPDWDDPCARAAWLFIAINKVAAGETVTDVRHGDERLAYGPGNYAALQQLYRDAVAACARKNGTKTGRRRAFVGRIIG